MTFDVKFDLAPMTLEAELGEVTEIEKIVEKVVEVPVKVPVEVPVESHDAEDAIIEHSISGAYKNDRVKTVGIYTFRSCSTISEADFSQVENIGDSAFTNCANLTAAKFPKAKTIGSSAFRLCSNLRTIVFPEAVTIDSQAFRYTGITAADFPQALTVNTSAFYGCASLAAADFPKLAKMDIYAFCECTNLTRLILRNDDAVCTLANQNAFSKTPIAAGTGFIYVPDALVDDYKSATNWAVFAARIRPLSEWEET